jgi:catechol 2,3-dioxygenase-like lactoylglutathione lyase family enzyme
MQIDHINISTPPALLLKVRDFYCEVLGLSEGFRPKFSKPGFWLYSEGKPIIHLVESHVHYPSERQGYIDHFAFQTTGLAQLIEKLDASGTRYRMNYLPEIDLSQIFCKDPAGTGVEINFCNESLGDQPGARD